MNLLRPLQVPRSLFHRLAVSGRRFLPNQYCQTFGAHSEGAPDRIDQILVINLASQPRRWANTLLELGRVTDSTHVALSERARRYPAVDARFFTQAPAADAEVDPFYTLRD